MYIISLRYFIPWVLPFPYTSTSIWLQQHKTLNLPKNGRKNSVRAATLNHTSRNTINHSSPGSPSTLIFFIFFYFFTSKKMSFFKKITKISNSLSFSISQQTLKNYFTVKSVTLSRSNTYTGEFNSQRTVQFGRLKGFLSPKGQINRSFSFRIAKYFMVTTSIIGVLTKRS